MLSPTKRLPSSLLVPFNRGPWLYCPDASATAGGNGSTAPPTTGDHEPVAPAVRTAAADLSRRHAAAVAASLHPSRPANAAPFCSAAPRPAFRPRHPLSAIARWKRPAAVGDAKFAHTAAPPADSPKIVTLFGLPPNASALRCTQRSAACWSWRP